MLNIVCVSCRAQSINLSFYTSVCVAEIQNLAQFSRYSAYSSSYDQSCFQVFIEGYIIRLVRDYIATTKVWDDLSARLALIKDLQIISHDSLGRLALKGLIKDLQIISLDSLGRVHCSFRSSAMQ